MDLRSTHTDHQYPPQYPPTVPSHCVGVFRIFDSDSDGLLNDQELNEVRSQPLSA